MREWIYLSAVLLVLKVTTCLATESIFHTFTGPQVRTFEAVVKQVDFKGRRVLVERKNNTSAWIHADLLSKDDLSYITEWYASWKVIADDLLLVNIEKKTEKSKLKKMADNWERRTPHQSLVSLENKSDAVIHKVLVEYCYYIISGTNTSEKPKPRKVTGTIKVGDLSVGEKKSVCSDSIILVTDIEVEKSTSILGSTVSEHILNEEKVLGIWFKIYGATADGAVAVRDLCIPEDLSGKVKWDYPDAKEEPVEDKVAQ